jgi:hypothetical protein
MPDLVQRDFMVDRMNIFNLFWEYIFFHYHINGISHLNGFAQKPRNKIMHSRHYLEESEQWVTNEICIWRNKKNTFHLAYMYNTQHSSKMIRCTIPRVRMNNTVSYIKYIITVHVH